MIGVSHPAHYDCFFVRGVAKEFSVVDPDEQ